MDSVLSVCLYITQTDEGEVGGGAGGVQQGIIYPGREFIPPNNILLIIMLGYENLDERMWGGRE